ncbi:hypothetical protein LPJ69_001998 [Coemansia sp. RSA 1752]|nr:hypothetical protein LPJ69_001998 [Coemansia sp. RSA 1752]
MTPNSFSVNSLLNASTQSDELRLTPLSTATESSGRGTAATGSSIGSPRADFDAEGTASPSVSMSSSPGRALLPRRAAVVGVPPHTQTPVHFLPISTPAATSYAPSNTASSHTSVVAPHHAPPLHSPTAGSHNLQHHYRMRDYNHNLYRHQARIPYEPPQHAPPHPGAGETHLGGAPPPYEPQNHRHQIPAVDYRFWPYPPPQSNMAARVAPQMMPPGPYFVHSTLSSAAPMHPGSSVLQSIHTPWRRERRSKACLRCHTKKIKCEGEGQICDGCKLAGCECKWVEMKKRGPKPKAKNQASLAENGADNNASAVPDNSITNGAAVVGLEPAVAKEAVSEATVQGNGLPAVSPVAQKTAVVSPPSLAPIAPSPAAPVPATPTQGPADTEPATLASAGGMELGEVTFESATMEQVLQRFHSDHVPADTRDAVTCYFDHLYARTPVFHPASFVRRVTFGQVEELLIDAIRLNTARLVMKRTGRHIDVAELTDSVHRRLLAGLDRPTVDYVRAVLLTSSHSGSESRFTTYNSLTCLAASLVMRLGWHTLDLGRGVEDVPWEEWVQLEEKRRTFWAVYQMDSYQSLMSDRPMTIDRSRICIATPGSDYTWDDVTMPQIMHWPTRHQPDIRKEMVIRMGALSYAFIELCSLMTIVTQINDFMWDVRVNVLVHRPGREWATDVPYMKPPPPPSLHAAREPVLSLFEYAEYRQLHDSLCEWRDGLIRAEDMRCDMESALDDISQLGSLENRRFSMRIRFFIMRCYLSAFVIILHGANRPSFFDPDRQLPKRVGKLVAAVAVSESEEDRVLRSLMSTAFSELLNDGFLAYDVVDESWEISLREVYGLMDHLDRNRDIPIDRCDGSISFCLFSSITVLVRQIRMCREQLDRGEARPGVRDELVRAVSTLRRMWLMLKDLGFIWGAHDMEQLLRTMQVDEIANAADLFSELKLAL